MLAATVQFFHKVVIEIQNAYVIGDLVGFPAGFCSVQPRVELYLISVRLISTVVRLMDKILHYLKDPKLWELWYIPYNG